MQGFVPQPDPQQHPLPPWEINDTRNSRPIPPFLFVNRKGVPRADINDKNRTRIKDNYQKHKHRLENDYNLTFLPKKPRMASRFTTASPGPDQDTTPKAPAMSDEVEKNDRAIHNALEKGCETRPKSPDMSNPRVSSAVVQIADGRGVTPTEGGDHKSLDTTADMDEEPPLKVEIWTDADAVDGKVDAVAVDGDNKAELQVDAPNVEILQNCTSDEDEDDPAQITVEQNETDIISKTDGDNREVDIEKPEPNMADKKIEADGKKKNHSGGFTATMRAVIQTNPNLPKWSGDIRWPKRPVPGQNNDAASQQQGPAATAQPAVTNVPPCTTLMDDANNRHHEVLREQNQNGHYWTSVVVPAIDDESKPEQKDLEVDSKGSTPDVTLSEGPQQQKQQLAMNGASSPNRNESRGEGNLYRPSPKEASQEPVMIIAARRDSVRKSHVTDTIPLVVTQTTEHPDYILIKDPSIVDSFERQPVEYDNARPMGASAIQAQHLPSQSANSSITTAKTSHRSQQGGNLAGSIHLAGQVNGNSDAIEDEQSGSKNQTTKPLGVKNASDAVHIDLREVHGETIRKMSEEIASQTTAKSLGQRRSPFPNGRSIEPISVNGGHRGPANQRQTGENAQNGRQALNWASRERFSPSPVSLPVTPSARWNPFGPRFFPPALPMASPSAQDILRHRGRVLVQFPVKMPGERTEYLLIFEHEDLYFSVNRFAHEHSIKRQAGVLYNWIHDYLVPGSDQLWTAAVAPPYGPTLPLADVH